MTFDPTIEKMVQGRLKHSPRTLEPAQADMLQENVQALSIAMDVDFATSFKAKAEAGFGQESFTLLGSDRANEADLFSVKIAQYDFIAESAKLHVQVNLASEDQQASSLDGVSKDDRLVIDSKMSEEEQRNIYLRMPTLEQLAHIGTISSPIIALLIALGFI